MGTNKKGSKELTITSAAGKGCRELGGGCGGLKDQSKPTRDDMGSRERWFFHTEEAGRNRSGGLDRQDTELLAHCHQ